MHFLVDENYLGFHNRNALIKWLIAENRLVSDF